MQRPDIKCCERLECDHDSLHSQGFPLNLNSATMKGLLVTCNSGKRYEALEYLQRRGLSAMLCASSRMYGTADRRRVVPQVFRTSLVGYTIMLDSERTYASKAAVCISDTMLQAACTVGIFPFTSEKVTQMVACGFG